ncbi:MAG: hypothetical protein U0163_05705 [Gemmatimonadaceae bacterium]
MRKSILIGGAVASLGMRPLAAQDENALRAAFEGKVVTVKMDMPATARGVEVFPQQSMPVNFREVAERIKDYGVALKMGQQVMVTKVLVKRDSHIEFQLGGGGYGTFGDYSPSSVSASSEPESKLERALKDSIKSAPGPTKRKQFEKELATARESRERENDKAKAEALQANAARETLLRQRRAEAGSRFNVRYKGGIPLDALSPQGVMQALAQYVDFTATAGATAGAAQATPGAATAASAPPPAQGSLSSLRKGLLLADVESLLGPASTATESKEGTLTVLHRNYRKDGMKIVARFVNDVLIDFTISPQ